MRNFFPHRGSNGFTLIELLVVIAIIGIVTTIASPSLIESIERRKIISAAEMISSDLKWARTESIKQNLDITVDFTDGAGGAWSYQITPTTPTKTVLSSNFSDFSSITLSQNFTDDDTGFEPVRGRTTDNGSITLSSSNFSIDVRISNIGRVRICSSTGVGGVDSC